MSNVAALVSGMLAAGYAVIAVFFLRFWRASRDRLFGNFALAFAVLAAQRILLSVLADVERAAIVLYAVRALAFLIIAFAIIDKNRSDSAA
jgi:hypothetical protein